MIDYEEERRQLRQYARWVDKVDQLLYEGSNLLGDTAIAAAVRSAGSRQAVYAPVGDGPVWARTDGNLIARQYAAEDYRDWADRAEQVLGESSAAEREKFHAIRVQAMDTCDPMVSVNRHLRALLPQLRAIVSRCPRPERAHILGLPD